MKILITGSRGFIGKNLAAELRNRNYTDLYEFDVDTREELLDAYCSDCGFVFHLAGVNRPQEQREFLEGNVGFLARLLESLKKHGNRCPVMLSSSIQAARDNPYGQSKRAAEDLLRRYGRETGAPVHLYRFPNTFGKWCRPNYNSVVATFCHNIARGLPIQIHDPAAPLQLLYIDDLVAELVRILESAQNGGGSAGGNRREGAPEETGAAYGTGNGIADGYGPVPVTYRRTVGEIAGLLASFRESRGNLGVPKLDDPFQKKLYSTYLSYLPPDQFRYPLNMNTDARGSFTELIRTPDRGQFSVNISKPGITKGNHWHHTKNEKFVVVSGKGLIRLRKLGSEEVIEYRVSGENIEVVDIPVGYTHNILNEGETDLVTFMWCNECFDPERPDTYFLEVQPAVRDPGRREGAVWID
ncbi:MAG: capsular polysaccharide biosynthesis protein CapF [Clostridium sp.]|jgi:UDP-2-acetamido-2,6-beta-L-arabino-hexul-4-ose reductase|nr:capsular polysaccharide biosynthesis protein CapF [Clostridium sp.]